MRFVHELRQALRALLKRPAWALLSVLALGLGIGASTAIFSVVNTVLIRPLPFDHPERIVAVYLVETDGNSHDSFSAPDFADLRAAAHGFAALAALRGAAFNTMGPEGPERLSGAVTTPSLLAVLGRSALLGPGFGAAGHEVVISDRLWRRRYAAAHDVAGKILTLNDEDYTIVGVMPADFDFPADGDVWATPRHAVPEHPLRPLEDPVLSSSGAHYLDVVGRLAPGVDAAAAEAELTALLAAKLQAQPGRDITGAHLIPLSDDLVGNRRAPLLILLGAVGLLLLIACVNVGHLLLARAVARRQEVAVRVALGARRRDIVRLFFAESLLLAGAGAALGLLIALWAAPPLLALAPAGLGDSVVLDGRVIAVTSGLALVIALIFGVTPALATPVGNPALGDGARTATGGHRRVRLREALIAAEVGLSLVLLIGATLLTRSFGKVLDVDPGFRTTQILTGQVWLPPAIYADPVKRARFYDVVLAQLAAFPDVEAAGAVTRLPMTSGNSSRTIDVPDKAEPAYVDADLRIASPGYFATLGIPLRAGRVFTADDRPGAPTVVVVNELFAKQAWPGQDPLGKSVSIMGDAATVVGVVGNLRHASLEAKPAPELYEPIPVDPWPFMTFVVRGRASPEALGAALRAGVAAGDRGVPLARVQTMTGLVEQSLSGRRFSLVVMAIFAGLALLLALIGVYGVISYAVEQRTRELGIRLALGARPRSLLALVVAQSLRPVLAGLILGTLGALAATRVLAGLLYEIAPTDVPTYVVAALVLAGTAGLAGLGAARRVTRVDPLLALRAE